VIIMPDLFRASGLYWTFGAIGDSWHGVPVRIPVALVRAAALARGGSIFLEDPDQRVEVLSGSNLSTANRLFLSGMVRRVNGVQCGFNIQEDSIGSRAAEVATRVYSLLSSYLNDLFGRNGDEVMESGNEILNGAVLLVSAIPGVHPVSAQLFRSDDGLVLKMTVRMEGSLEDIEVTVGGG